MINEELNNIGIYPDVGIKKDQPAVMVFSGSAQIFKADVTGPTFAGPTLRQVVGIDDFDTSKSRGDLYG